MSFKQWEKGGEQTSARSNVLIAMHHCGVKEHTNGYVFQCTDYGQRVGETQIDWILYAHQLEHNDELRRKSDILLRYFEIRRHVITEGGKVRIEAEFIAKNVRCICS